MRRKLPAVVLGTLLGVFGCAQSGDEPSGHPLDSGDALGFVVRAGQVADEAHLRADLGEELHHRLGDVDHAFAQLDWAPELFRQDRAGEIGTLYQRARLLRERGELEAAVDLMETVLDLVEGWRASVRDREGQLALLDSRHTHFEFYIDLLMELHARDASGGWAERALRGVEIGRARLLLDLVNESGAETAGWAKTVGLREIQEELLDAESALLVYALGDERGFVFLVTRDALIVRELPGREEIEGLASRFHELLLQSSGPMARRQARRYGARLSEKILGPVAERLDRRRLLVLPDGALHYVPFAALPRPGSGEVPEPLVARHEIVYLPSASVLAALRRNRERRPPPPGGLAVVADPVFRHDDARLPPGVAVPASQLEGFEPLPFARREAETLLRLVPENRGLAVLGFDASRETVTNGVLRDSRYVHFAAHGLFNAELSGLLLSRFDAAGREVDGLLSLSDVYALDLSAELVVLSACRTALGRRLRGEGLLGLTQGFLHAGAQRTVVSLWDVDDEATAELMESFYRRVLVDGVRPAAALAAAQDEMRRREKFAAPYYWAAFVLQGEWR